MSAIECTACGWLIDTDDDPDAIWDDADGKTHIECETCRELRALNEERAAAKESLALSKVEEQ